MLEFFSAGANDYVFGLDQLAISGTPQPGDTSLNLTFDANAIASGGAANVTDASQGDTTYATQLSQRLSDTGINYIGLTRIYQTSSFSLAANTTNTFSTFDPSTGNGGIFYDVSTANPTSLDIRTTQFSSLLGGFNPGAANCANLTTVDPQGLCFATVNISAIPSNVAAPGIPPGFYGDSADLLFLQLAPGGPDVQTGTMFYGMPITGSWAQPFIFLYGALVQASAPGATRGAFSPNEIFWVTDVATASASPIVPPLSAPQNITVVPTSGGASGNFYSDQTGIGTSPTIS